MSGDAERPSKRLAVLIDADNASPAVIGPLLVEVAGLGSAIVKRIYGDFTLQNLASWRSPMADHAIQPIQQFRNTVGKNASDSALIIDAMDLLHAGRLEGFCIVSSDSDFTRLATRIREHGLKVYGFGERKTPKPFIAACDRFIYTELFRAKPAPARAGEAPKPEVETPPLRDVADKDFRLILDQAFDAVVGDDKRTRLGILGQQIQRIMPDFDPRNYGVKKLSDLVDREDGYATVREQTDAGNALVWVEREPKPPAPRRRAPRKR